MKDYDVIVIGSGAGAIIVEQALIHDLKVALVDKGPLGGTCLNVGCISIRPCLRCDTDDNTKPSRASINY